MLCESATVATVIFFVRIWVCFCLFFSPLNLSFFFSRSSSAIVIQLGYAVIALLNVLVGTSEALRRMRDTYYSILAFPAAVVRCGRVGFLIPHGQQVCLLSLTLSVTKKGYLHRFTQPARQSNRRSCALPRK